jgi:transcriptional regulator with XRE-family HTH domain
MNELGKRLKKLRDESGLSVRGLAEKVGVTPGYISRIEARGEVPSPEFLCKLAAQFDVRPEALLDFAKKAQLQKVAGEITTRQQSALALFRKGKK